MTKNNLNSKFAVLVFAILLHCNFIFAQNPECQVALKAFQEMAKEADFNAIYTSWGDLKKTCGSSDESAFIITEKLLDQKVEEASASDEKNQMIQKLISVYDDHDKAFPGNKRGNRISKAILLFENKQGTPDEIYGFLDQNFKTDNAGFTNPNVLNIYADLIVGQFTAAEKKLTADQTLEKLDQVSEKVQSESKKAQSAHDNLMLKSQTETLSAAEKNILQTTKTALQELKLVSGNLNGNIDKLANCEALTAFYQKGFDKNAENALWLERASERLNSKKCKSDLYLKISEKWNAVSPTAKSSYNLAILARQNKNREKTIEYFTQSASLETDANKKSDIFYLIATTYVNDKPKAKEFAKKAIEAKPSSGKSYIFLAQLYSSGATDCGKDSFEKKAIYWLAANTAKQAGIAEPMLKKSADQLAEGFNKQAPSKAEISQAKRKAGEQISFDCWIGESISIPKL